MPFMLSVASNSFLLSVIALNALMLRVVILSVVMPSVVMLKVVAALSPKPLVVGL
jgi:hypothetical protein